MKTTLFFVGPGSSVGIANDWGLDGLGSNPGMDEIIRSSRPVLGPTQPPVKWVPDLSPGGKLRPGRTADHSPPSSAAVMEKYNCTSTHPLGYTGPATGSHYRFYSLITSRIQRVSVSVTTGCGRKNTTIWEGHSFG